MNKVIDKRNLKTPLTLAFLACFVIVALIANNRADSVPAAAGADGRQIIILDAGHGGADPGCVGIGGELEKDINLAIVMNLRELLEFSGFAVVLTRDTDISIHDEGVEGLRKQKLSDMENRRKIILDYPESLFLSVHQNKFTQPQYFGAQMFYSAVNKDNFKLAQIMQESFRGLQPENDREVKLIDGELYLFKNTPQPALLIECGFLSNAGDAANLNDSEYQKKTAFTIYRGIIGFYKQNAAQGTAPKDVQTEGINGETQGILYMQ